MKAEATKSRTTSDKVRIQLANTYTLTASIYCAVFSVVFYFLTKNIALSVVHFLALIVVAANYLVLKQSKDFKRATNIILATGTTVVVSLFATGGWEKSGYLWPFAYLPFATFLTPRNQTKYWILALFISCIAMVGLHLAGALTIPYSAVEMFNFFAALTVFSTCIFVYQKSTIDYEYFLAYTGSLLEAGKDPFFTINSDGRIDDINMATQTFTGKTADMLIGAGISSCFTESDKVRNMQKHLFRWTYTQHTIIAIT